MTSEEMVQYIKDKHKFPMTFDDYTNYFIFMFPLFFITMGLVMVYNFFKFDSGATILLVSILAITIGILFFYFTYKRLRETITFEEIPTSGDDTIETLANKIEDQFKLKNIAVDKNLGSIVAYTKWSAFSWGEKLTLVIDSKMILVNSRPSGAMPQPVTIMKDKSNIKKIKQMLHADIG